MTSKMHLSKITKNKLAIINKGKIFLIISLTNSILPILLCIISSYINPFGAQVVMGVGYTVAFLVTFSQIGISFAISIFFIISKKYQENLNLENNSPITISKIMSHAIYISFIMGLVLSIFFVSSSYLYLYFSCNRPNTMQTIEFGINFVATSVIYISLISLINLFILYINLYNKHLGLVLHVLFISSGLILSYIFGITLKMGALGIGLGLSTAAVLLLIIVILLIIKMYSFNFLKPNLEFKNMWRLFKDISNEAVAGISLSIYKAFGLLILSLSLPVLLNNYVPLSYQMSRVIWFNLMYALIWVSIGISDSIKYYNIYNLDQSLHQLKISKFYKLIIISMIITTLFVILGYYIVEPLSKIYIQNNQYDGSWNLPLLPETFPLLSGMKAPTNIIEYKNFLKDDLPLIVARDPDWFINQNHLIAFTKWNIQVIDFDLQYTKYNSNIISALINKGVQLSPFEFYAIKDFSANTYIYIGVYSILCSGWTVILPATRSIHGKGINLIILSFIYAIILGSVIAFGTYYSFYKPISWFQYLDAWTFPVMLVGCIVFIYTMIKMIIFSVKLSKIKKADLWNQKIIEQRNIINDYQYELYYDYQFINVNFNKPK